MTVSIGKLTDTPDSGDPILSPWYQEIATYARHVFATKAELDAQWSAAPNGAHAFTTADSATWNRIGGAWIREGLVAYAATATAQTGITAVTDLTGLNVTWTATATRRYRFTLSLWMLSTVVGDTVRAYVTPTGSPIAVLLMNYNETKASMGATMQRSASVSGLSGSVTYRARLERFAGSGSAGTAAGAGYESTLTVEDVGAV